MNKWWSELLTPTIWIGLKIILLSFQAEERERKYTAWFYLYEIPENYTDIGWPGDPEERGKNIHEQQKWPNCILQTCSTYEKNKLSKGTKTEEGERDSSWTDEEGPHWAPCVLRPESDSGGRRRHSQQWGRLETILSARPKILVHGCSYQVTFFTSHQWEINHLWTQMPSLCLLNFIMLDGAHQLSPLIYFESLNVSSLPLSTRPSSKWAITMVSVCLKFPSRLT